MIGVIADDLTGAAEIGGIAFEHGLEVEIHTRPGLGSEAGVVVLDTDSRSLAPDAAARAAAAAARWLRDLGVRKVFKKVDSVLRGRIVPEVLAIAQEARMRDVLLLPQNPSRGRTIENGQYFVEGCPIHQTQFRFDPEYPRTSPDVLELLSAGQAPAAALGNPDGPLPTTGICLAQASTIEQVEGWARRVSPQTLPAGGADFFRAWLGLVSRGKTRPRDHGLTTCGRPVLFVCGSATETARSFVESAKNRGIHTFSLRPAIEETTLRGAVPDEVAEPLTREVAHCLTHRKTAILEIGPPLLPGPEVAQILCRWLAGVACRVIQDSGPLDIRVEGGATAAALARENGWCQFNVLAQPGTGIVTLGPRTSPHCLTIKPGSYPWPTQIAGTT